MTTALKKKKKTAKGIKKCAIKNQLRHANYKDCLFNNTNTVNTMNLIKSQNHELFMVRVVKKVLCNFDSKRFWRNCTNSFAYGHFNIQSLFGYCIYNKL